ncbi:hypothetical protein NQ314_010670 [Rhamnusium bicolor]|uniref:Transposase n=1 Tax=Rhamnusium bicolor TaxID=1586634 RepID=A0AAV8XPS7_9CUCU|nr:hypothetical protein NQ314_010670 [Rhamnusium bicolor]
MSVKDLQPFSVVNDEGFRELMAEVEPAYQLPSRTTFSRTLLPSKYDEAVILVKNKFRDAESISITTDTWTSSATENYIAITAHYLDKNWIINSLLVDCFKFGESHTSQNLRNELLKSLREWDILKKVHCVITDNAFNIRMDSFTVFNPYY